MKRLVVVLSIALAGFVPSAAHAAAAVPPDLAALEQQMTQLQASSERFSFQEELSLGSGLLGQGIPLTLLIAGEGEGSDSPPQASAVGGLFGTREQQVKVIGESTYQYKRQAAEVDGGRPWVRSHRAPAQQAQGLDPGGLLENDQGGKQGTFSKLIEQLNGALAIVESGPVTVDGQRVIEFDATLDPTPFLAQLESHSKQPKHPLTSLFEIPSVGGPNSTPKAPSPPPTLELELFIAPNGLPVRARLTFAAEGVSIAVRVDTLAINVPVNVTPPPASQTIDEAQLASIERRHAERELKDALRGCRRLHGKRAAACRLLARSRSRRPTQPEPSPL